MNKQPESDVWTSLSNVFGKVMGTPGRVPNQREFPLPMHYYHPLVGVPGMTENPHTLNSRTHIPPQRNINPSTIAASTVKPEDHVILGDINFWRKYHARKTNSWGSNYDRMHNLTPESYAPKTELRQRNIGTGTQLSGFTRHQPVPYKPIQYGVVSISSVTSRP